MKDELREAMDYYRRLRATETADFKKFVKDTLIKAVQGGNFAISVCAMPWPNITRQLIREWLAANDCHGQFNDYQGSIYLDVVYKGYQA